MTEAWSALEKNDVARVLELVTPHLDSSTPALATEANKLAGLAHFRQNRFDLALPFFQRVAEGSDDAGTWFNVVTSAALAHQLPVAEEAFTQALACQEKAGYTQQPSVPFIRFYYACALRDVGAYEAAFAQIGKLREIYENLRITDTMFLHMRGVPFFSHSMELAVEIMKALKIDPAPWLDALSKNVDEEGADLLHELRERIGSNEQDV